MENKKKCPYCGEEILAVAKKCKHCGEWLDENENKSASKTCPTCGEAIKNDTEICPHCKEPISSDDIEHVSVSNMEVSDVNNNDSTKYYNCKCCGQQLSSDATTCTQCGTSDPFRFNEIKKKEKQSHIGCGSLLFLGIFVEVCFGSNRGILNWHSYEIGIFVLIAFIILFVSKYYLKKRVDEISKEMYDTFVKADNEKSFSGWQDKAHQIVGESWSEILWFKLSDK